MPAVHATLILTSPWMLGFVAVIAVPWWLAQRPQLTPQKVGLATTAFVLEAARRQPRWRRSTRWLVPLLRSLLVAAVACAAAGPQWHPSDAAVVTRGHRVTVLDDSADGHGSAAVTAAMASFDDAGSSTGGLQVNRVAASDAAAGALPNDTTLVVITDGAHLSASQLADLSQWTVRGGQLLVLLGPASTALDNASVATWLHELAGVQIRGRRQTEGEALRIPASLPGGPAVISGPSVSTHAVVAPQQQHRAGHPLTEPRVLLETVQAEPLLVTRGVGQGSVAISAVPWDLAAADRPSGESAWSDLPAWPAFPNVVNDVLTSMAAHAPIAPPGIRDTLASWAFGGNLAGALLMLSLGLAAVEAIVVRVTGQRRQAR